MNLRGGNPHDQEGGGRWQERAADRAGGTKLKRNNNSRTKKQGKNYFEKLDKERMFAANQGFMAAIMDLPVALRWKFGWMIIFGISPMTGKTHWRKCGLRFNLGFRPKFKAVK